MWLEFDEYPPLQPDRGKRFTDHNSGRFRTSPMEPAIQAVLHQQPDFDFSTLDLITDRQSLVCLLELAIRKDASSAMQNPSADDEMTGIFSFWAQVVGNTVVFVRDVENPVEVIKKFRGFRKEFDRTYLQYHQGLKDTDSYQRIVTYRLGDLKLMVRHPANGYIPDNSLELKEALESFKAVSAGAGSYGNVKIKSGGALIPRSAMLELNTHKKDGWFAQGDRLNTKIRETWLSQQEHYIIAPYTELDVGWIGKKDFTKRRAVFEPHHLYNAAELMSNWEEENQEAIREFYDRLLQLLNDIRFKSSTEGGINFKIERTKESQDIRVTPSNMVPGLSEELCRRLEMKLKENEQVE